MSETTEGVAADAAATRTIRVLVIEDNPGDVRLVRESLLNNGTAFDVDAAGHLAHGLETLDPERHDAVLLDLGLPDSHGLATFTAVAERASDIPIVILTVTGDEAMAVRAVAAGAQDYLVKDELPPALLPRAVRYAIERQRVLRNLRGLSEDLRAFIAQAAHDLRTPIATVAGLAETLETSWDALPDEELDVVLGGVRRQAGRLSELVTDLLDIAKLQGEVTLEPVDLPRTVERALRDAPPPDRVSIGLRLPADLPPVSAHPSRLERLVTNLLTNGYRYGGDRVLLSAEAADGHVAFIVEDGGSGVPADLLDDLFKPFVRGANSPNEGTGLGLSIVRQLAVSFGGSVRYEDGSALGGARFVVALPCWRSTP